MKKRDSTTILIVKTQDGDEQFTLRPDSPYLETRGRLNGRAGTLSDTVEFAGRILRRQLRKCRS